MTVPFKVAILISTLDRPRGLRDLLVALERLNIGAWKASSVVVVVVDNSAAGSARAVCDERVPKGRFGTLYTHEPRRGLAFARNAALRAADVAGATHAAFIDDDEIPDPGWLLALHDKLTEAGAAAVVGPIFPVFSGDPPMWSVQGDFFAKALQPVDGILDDAYTCNAMIDLGFATQHGLSFDPRFNYTGGEDTMFFRALRTAGGKIVWAGRAVVHEHISRSRTNRNWVMRRWFRTGGTEAELGRMSNVGVPGRLYNAARGIVRIGWGVVKLAVVVVLHPRDPARQLKAAYSLCRGAGLVAASFGRTYAEYTAPSYKTSG